MITDLELCRVIARTRAANHFLAYCLDIPTMLPARIGKSCLSIMLTVASRKMRAVDDQSNVKANRVLQAHRTDEAQTDPCEQGARPRRVRGALPRPGAGPDSDCLAAPSHAAGQWTSHSLESSNKQNSEHMTASEHYIKRARRCGAAQRLRNSGPSPRATGAGSGPTRPPRPGRDPPGGRRPPAL